MEVVSNSRANPVNRIMGRAQFDFLPPNIVNPKCLKGLFRKELFHHLNLRFQVRLGFGTVFMYIPRDQLNGGGHVSLDIVTYRG